MQKILSALLISAVAAILVVGLLKSGAVTVGSRAPVAAKESTYDRVMRTGTIHCGYSVWKPLMWVDPNSNKKIGIFPDLIEAIGKRLGLKIIWQEELGWGTVVESVKSGRVDMACAGYWLQPNRFKYVASSTPLFYAPIYVWGRESETRFKNLQDLNSDQVTVGDTDGGATLEIVKQRFPKAKILSLSELSTNVDLIESLITKKVDFVTDDATTFQDYAEKYPNKVKNLFPDQPVGLFPAVMLLPPDDPHFKQMIDDAMRSLEYDGTLDAILSAYHMENGFLRNPKPVKASIQNPPSNP
ncbi:MAG: transporter substrate-binding domain-containing protein [Alphaproteobacteria bacterium]|nr:transporter substrate-binding domain-containing protein [Alphaproteobacteria bacterium]